MRPRSAVRVLLCLAALLTLRVLAAGPPAAAAQGFCTDPSQCPPPSVSIDPAEGSFSGSAASHPVAVTITWCDEQTSLSPVTREITLDGAVVTGSFDYVPGMEAGCASYATSSGVVTLSPGVHTLRAKIRNSQNWGASEAVYQYTQGTPLPPVRVAPDAKAATRGAATAGVERFTVVNHGALTATYVLEAVCAGTTGTCAPTLPWVTLAPGDTAGVGVSYTTPGAGAQATVKLRAWNQDNGAQRDSGWHVVSAAAAEAQGLASDAGVTVNVNRADCVTLPVALAGTYECGDLRLAMPLPGVRVLNRGFAPTLIYNSQHARPFPVVAANVTLPGGAAPSAVVATLTLASGVTHTRRFAGWAAGESRRVAVGFDATGLPSGFYAYTFSVQAEYGAAPELSDDGAENVSGDDVPPLNPVQPLYSQGGTLALVNRAASPFGAGWWLAGLEQLQQGGDGTLRWFGGDGSTQRYLAVPGAANRWYAEPYDGADTIVYTPADALYRRVMTGGDTVVFNAAGTHVATVNRHGQRTEFQWQAGELTLHLPKVPGVFDTGYAYSFVWGNAGGKLSRVVAPGGREVQVGVDASGRVTGFDGPDTTYVRMGYWDAMPRVGWWDDRRHVRSYFLYDAASRLDIAYYLRNPTTAAAQHYDPQESWGVESPTPLGWLYTGYNGPRDDVADAPDHVYFYVNRRGAPTGSTNLLGHTTEVFREDPRWPGRVTRVRYPNGRVVTHSYDDAGRLVASTDWSHAASYGTPTGGFATRYATTLYEWDERCGEVARVTLPEGEKTTRGYDARCRLEWVQPGSDARRRATLAYRPLTDPSAPGLVASVASPAPYAGQAARTETFDYDARGNLRRTTSPMGVRRELLNDALGRVIRVSTQIDSAGTPAPRFQADSTGYDVMGRVRHTRSRNPAGDTAVVVQQEYDQEGSLKRVERSVWPNPAGLQTLVTRFDYDPAGRTIAEWAPDGAVERTDYDAAGNPIQVTTRRGHVITLAYDTLNRLKRRSVPAHTYARRREGIAANPNLGVWRSPENPSYPRYPTSLVDSSYTIAADVETFTYDAMGNLLTAENADARVKRSYLPNGLLRTDTLRVRATAGTDFGRHAYGLENVYDLNGRRIVLYHPRQLGPSGSTSPASTLYSYERETGALQTVMGPLGDAGRYHYNLAGELDTLYLPGAAYLESYRYDADGRLREHRVANGSTLGRQTTLVYDGRGKTLRAENTRVSRDTLSAVYSGLGHLGRSEFTAWGARVEDTSARYRSVDTYTQDPLANRVSLSAETWKTFGGLSEYRRRVGPTRYDPATGRVRAIATEYQTDTTHYDAAGNTVFTTQSTSTLSSGASWSDRASYYGADGRLRAVDHRFYASAGMVRSFFKRAFEEYRYDALGRRVWVRARRACEEVTQEQEECRVSLLRRTVWDGDRELYEIQMPGGDAETVETLENDTLPLQRSRLPLGLDPNPFFGRVAYTHGLALDRPVTITRIGYSDWPHWAGWYAWNPYTLVPLWNSRGDMDNSYFPATGGTLCISTDRCAKVPLSLAWKPFGTHGDKVPIVFQGTLVEEKSDYSGLGYMRNRYYDPQSGTFTQEDPIGLAGGLNLYGFANGDPVTYSDPYGLSADTTGRGAASQFSRDQRAFSVVPAGSVRPGVFAGAAARFVTPFYVQGSLHMGPASVSVQAGGKDPGLEVEPNLPPTAPGLEVRGGLELDTARRGELPVDVGAGPVQVGTAVDRRGNERVTSVSVGAGTPTRLPQSPVTAHPRFPEIRSGYSCAKVGC